MAAGTTRAVFALASMQYLWNIARVAPLSGYDAPGHAAYALTILEGGRLPHPLEGWSTFHPPLYYLVLSAVWGAFSWLGPGGQLFVGRLVSAGAMLGAAAVLHQILRKRGTEPLVGAAVVALALFLPATQLAATTLGNEALGVLFASLALPSVLALQTDPTDRRSAITAGLFAGLALATKYTGLFVASACLVPFLRRDLTAGAWRSVALGALAATLVAGPIYLRNVWLTGSPIPMTREDDLVARGESLFVVRERRIADYIGLPIETLLRPSLLQRPGDAPPRPGAIFNEAHVHVWGSAYASLWYDTYARRLPQRAHRDGVLWGPLLTGLGLVPMATLLVGILISMQATWERRGRSRDAPLVAMGVVGLLAFVAFTVRNPSMVASKGSYLLPLMVPAGVLFARGAGALSTGARRMVLCVSAAAALSSALVFTADLVFEPRPLPPTRVLLRQAAELGVPYQVEALKRFLVAR
jgi:hypothetical protein